MEKIRNKKGQVVSYREKVYVDGKAITKTFKRKSDATNWKKNYSSEVKKREALGIGHIQTIEFEPFFKQWFEMKKMPRPGHQNTGRLSINLQEVFNPTLKKSPSGED